MSYLLKVITRRKSGTAGIWTCDLFKGRHFEFLTSGYVVQYSQ